jgi:hypothetical protein
MQSQLMRIFLIIFLVSCQQGADVNLSEDDLNNYNQSQTSNNIASSSSELISFANSLLDESSQLAIDNYNNAQIPANWQELLGASASTSVEAKALMKSTELVVAKTSASYLSEYINNFYPISFDKNATSEAVDSFFKSLKFESVDSSSGIVFFTTDLDCGLFDFSCRSLQSLFSIGVNKSRESVSLHWMKAPICELNRQAKMQYSLNCNINTKLLHSIVKNTLLESEDEKSTQLGEDLLKLKLTDTNISGSIDSKSFTLKASVPFAEYAPLKSSLRDFSVYVELSEQTSSRFYIELGHLETNYDYQAWIAQGDDGYYQDQSVGINLAGGMIEVMLNKLALERLRLKIDRLQAVDNLNEGAVFADVLIPDLEFEFDPSVDAENAKLSFNGSASVDIQPFADIFGSSISGWMEFVTADQNYFTFSMSELRENGIIYINEDNVEVYAGLDVDQENIFDEAYDVNNAIDADYLYKLTLSSLGLATFDDLIKDEKEPINPLTPFENYDSQQLLALFQTPANLAQMSNITASDLNNINFGNNWNVVLPAIDVTNWDTTDLDLSYLDLTQVSGMTVAMLDNAQSLYGAKLPAMDVTEWDTTDLDLSHVDLSRVSNLTATMLNQASRIDGAILPAMDVTGWDTSKDYSMSNVDLSNVSNFTVEMLNNSNHAYGAKLPAMNVSGWTTDGKNLNHMDLSRVSGLSVSQLERAYSTQGVILPSMSVMGWETQGRDLSMMDLTRVTDFDVTLLSNAASVWGAKLPEMDVESWNTSGVNISGMDLSRVTNFTALQLNQSSEFQAIKLPAMMSMTGWVTNERNIYGIDLSQVTNLTVSMINDASPGVGGVKLPAINVTGLNMKKHYGLQGMDLSLVSGLTVAMLNNIEYDHGLAGVKLPAMNVTGWDTTGLYLVKGCDVSRVIGFTAEMLNDSAQFYGITLPSNLDLTNLNLLGKRVTYTDFSQAVNLDIDVFSQVEEMGNDVKLPSYLLLPPN